MIHLAPKPVSSEYPPRMSAGHDFINKLPPQLLWDVDPSSLDADQHAAFLICRIMDRGDIEQVRHAWSYYGEEQIKQALLAAPSLGRKTITFFANQFVIPCEAFRSWQRNSHWQP
jgi:hypothetical protein